MASYIGIAPPTQTGIVNRYQYTGDGSTTVYSGNDNNSAELRYTSTNPILVYLNGVQLYEGTDYTKSSNTSVTFASAPALNDTIEILTFGSFDLNSPSTLRNDLGIELSSGEILYGNTSNQTGKYTLSGTSNEIEINTTSNTVTVGLPDDVTVSNNLTVNSTLKLNNIGYVYSNSVDFTTTSSSQTLDTFTTTQHRTAKYIIQSHSGADIHATELLVSHDGVNAYTSIINTIYSDISLITLSASISSGTVTIAVTPTYENTTVDFVRISMTGSTLDTAFDFEGDLQSLGGSDIDLQSDTGDAVDLAGTFAGDLQTQSGSVDLSSSELVGFEDLNA